MCQSVFYNVDPLDVRVRFDSDYSSFCKEVSSFVYCSDPVVKSVHRDNALRLHGFLSAIERFFVDFKLSDKDDYDRFNFALKFGFFPSSDNKDPEDQDPEDQDPEDFNCLPFACSVLDETCDLGIDPEDLDCLDLEDQFDRLLDDDGSLDYGDFFDDINNFDPEFALL